MIKLMSRVCDPEPTQSIIIETQAAVDLCMFVQAWVRTKLSLESGGKKGPSARLGRLGSTVLHVDAESACSEIAFELFCRIVLHLIVTCKQPVTCLHESKVMIAPVYIKETCAFQVLLTTQV